MNKEIVPLEDIKRCLEKTRGASAKDAGDIIKKGEERKGLSPEETAVLLQCDDEGVKEQLFKAAKSVKEAIYGNRLVLFAPLYLSNSCVNNCLYCGFRAGNKIIEKRFYQRKR